MVRGTVQQPVPTEKAQLPHHTSRGDNAQSIGNVQWDTGHSH